MECETSQILHTHVVAVTNGAAEVHRVQVIQTERSILHQLEQRCETRTCVLQTFAHHGTTVPTEHYLEKPVPPSYGEM